MIQLIGLKKRFGEREILKGVDLHVRRGETICLVGGSGAGKSVTLKHMVRLLEPDEGQILFDKVDISHARGKTLADARRKMGMNFQSAALIAWLTVFENCALPLREHTRMSEQEITARVMEVLEILRIDNAAQLMPRQISGGMQKRAGLARAIIWKPPVILYDEPTSGLDPISTARVDEMVNDMREQLGSTQVIITHDMASAYRTADRIAMLHEGRIVQEGTPDDIKNTQNPIVRQFIEGLTNPPEVRTRGASTRPVELSAADRTSSETEPSESDRDALGAAAVEGKTSEPGSTSDAEALEGPDDSKSELGSAADAEPLEARDDSKHEQAD
jgi:phospholipid/cholesterol/gamma-HCH transport system ATP-binding protein